jgi:hypothetical protein
MAHVCAAFNCSVLTLFYQVVRIDAELDHEAQPEWVLFNEFTWNDNIDIIRRVTVVTAEM